MVYCTKPTPTNDPLSINLIMTPPPPPPETTLIPTVVETTTTTTSTNPLHNELLHHAKINQINDLKNSSIYSKQLIQILTTIIKTNSNSESSELIDKIITIHQLNQTIDKQLNQDISKNFYELMKYKEKLKKIINDCQFIIQDIDNLQSRSELIDQDLRILENTLKLINK